MPQIAIHNQTRPFARPLNAAWCSTFISKFRGLMGHAPLSESEALLLVEPRSSRMNSAIHMLFMRMDISVIWLDEQKRVVDKRLARAWHLAYVPEQPACYTIEAHIDRLQDFHIGDQVLFSHE